MDDSCPTLYINYLSPVARATAIVAAATGVKVNIKVRLNTEKFLYYER